MTQRHSHARRLGIAIALAVGLLVAPTAPADDLEVERDFPWYEDLRNVYFVTAPFAEGIEDVANTTNVDPCDTVDTGPDGVVNADDLLCTLWGGGDLAEQRGAMSVVHYDGGACSYRARTGLKLPTGERLFIGGGFQYQPEFGYTVQVGRVTEDAPPPVNRVVLSGHCDPAFPGRLLVPIGCQNGAEVLHYPYNALYRTVDEILCGLEGVDWMPDPVTGNPDTCPNGLFMLGEDGAAVSVVLYNNDPDAPSPNQYIGRSVVQVPGSLVFVGSNYELKAGEAYLAYLSVKHSPTFWDPPTDECGGGGGG